MSIAWIELELTERTTWVTDEDQLAQFVTGEYPGLVAALSLVCGDRSAAEDAVQEALARAVVAQRRGSIDSLPAWVRVVALNQLRNRWRSRSREQKATQLLRDTQVPSGVGDELEDSMDLMARPGLALTPSAGGGCPALPTRPQRGRDRPGHAGQRWDGQDAAEPGPGSTRGGAPGRGGARWLISSSGHESEFDDRLRTSLALIAPPATSSGVLQEVHRRASRRRRRVREAIGGALVVLVGGGTAAGLRTLGEPPDDRGSASARDNDRPSTSGPTSTTAPIRGGIRQHPGQCVSRIHLRRPQCSAGNASTVSDGSEHTHDGQRQLLRPDTGDGQWARTRRHLYGQGDRRSMWARRGSRSVLCLHRSRRLLLDSSPSTASSGSRNSRHRTRCQPSTSGSSSVRMGRCAGSPRAARSASSPMPARRWPRAVGRDDGDWRCGALTMVGRV